MQAGMKAHFIVGSPVLEQVLAKNQGYSILCS